MKTRKVTEEEIDNAKGNCYKANTEYILNKSFENPTMMNHYYLCFGDVIGANNSEVKGKIFPHCWVEIDDSVMIDVSNNDNIIVPLKLIEHRILRDSVLRIKAKDVPELALKYKYYCDWREFKNE